MPIKCTTDPVANQGESGLCTLRQLKGAISVDGGLINVHSRVWPPNKKGRPEGRPEFDREEVKVNQLWFTWTLAGQVKNTLTGE